MLSGVVLIPVVIYLVLYLGPLWIVAVSTLIALLALIELNGMGLHRKRDGAFDLLGALTGASCVPVVFFLGMQAFLPLLAVLVFFYFLYGILCKRELADASLDASHKVLGVAYLGLPLSFLPLLADMEQGRWWLLFLLVVIWSNDTFAYFIGKKIGKHRLAPEVSPKKSIEGAIGGIAGGALAGAIFVHYTGLQAGLSETVVMTVVIGLVAMAGDLAESVIKRAAGVKDSGTMIPGHGGVLDRIDSLIFPIPLLFCYLVVRSFYA